jgi:hypothetical protein
VQRRCVSPLRPRDSGCRPRHGLHGQEQIAAYARLPGVFQGAGGRARAYAGRLGEASEHQAGILAKVCQRQAAQTEEIGKGRRELTATLVACRIPLAILLIFGGIFSLLPVLGLWMLPLGLVLFAQDLPFLESRWRGCSGGLSANGSSVSAQKARNDPLARLFDSISGSAAAHGVTQKPTSLINQGLRHN